MTKSDFTSGYCTRSKITKDDFYKWMVALPCACGENNCEGWAAIRLDSVMIEDHLTFCAPAGIRKYYA